MRRYRIRKEHIYGHPWWVMTHLFCMAEIRSVYCLTWEEARDEIQRHHDRWHRERLGL